MRIITDGLYRPGWGLLTTLEVSQGPGCDALTILVRFEAWQDPGCENHWRIFHYKQHWHWQHWYIRVGIRDIR